MSSPTLLKASANNTAKPGHKDYWSQLSGSAKALAVASHAQSLQRLLVVVTPDTQSAFRLETEVKTFIGDANACPVLHFPDWETLPYDNFSPHEDIISERLHTLSMLPQAKTGVLIVPVTTLMHRLPPVKFVTGNSLNLQVGDTFDVIGMREQLANNGYRSVDTVYEHGEFSVRGALVDIYPMGSEVPYRVDLFDDEIETLRTFDPETQRTLDHVDTIALLPAKEFPLDKPGITLFKNQWHAHFDVNHKQCPIYQDISAGIAPPGIEYYLPLFFEQTATLFDYLPKNSILLIDGVLEQPIQRFWQETQQRYSNRGVDPLRPILPPHALFLPIEGLFQAFKEHSQIQIDPTSNTGHHFNTSPLPNIAANHRAEVPLVQLEQFLLETDLRILFCVESAGRRETLLEMLDQIGVKPVNTPHWKDFANGSEKHSILVAPLDKGFIATCDGFAIITESELLGERIQQQRRRRKASENQAEQAIRNLSELAVGAPVVHIEHGVGRYLGLESITIDNQTNEFLALEYANQAKLYVPVSNLQLISRYSGADDGLAPLHKLGSDQWDKAKRKAAEKIRDVAAELLDIYARREAKPGFAYADPARNYQIFASDFPFEETPDQQMAIEAVFNDMTSKKAMDRLVCGDVGFGKTEVAMRAAFVAVHSGKQVAVLVPTTLLAQQHYDNFKDRFAQWPVTIDILSRFRSTKEVDSSLDKLAKGKVDIIVGTHKLLQKDIRYKNLGLVIIDEEHRFGVRQKEQLKALRADVDILTLTATPIPRTLNMAMSGVRDLSIIATPPAKRLSVKTFVRESEAGLIKEAVLREILRGGQIYYLHNEVKSIEKTAKELQELIPEARIVVAHGQLRERQLEQVMSDFYHQRYNILVCSTIIETGIDIPNANTIIIDRADKFGLAQLHQLRGRVGRSHHQAYAYLLTPNKRAMTADAVKRLEAIAQTTELGAGFTLATQDMEIRGAGELLGEDQSGQMQTVGFSLYMEMLDRAVKAIKSGQSPELLEPLEDPNNIDINLRLPALIPEDYIPDVQLRLTLYKRISAQDNDESLRELQVEMIDRFGLLPEPTKNLFRQTLVKLKCIAMGIQKLEASNSSGKIEFTNKPAIDPMNIVTLVQQQPQIYRLEGANHLKFVTDMQTVDTRFNAVETLLGKLKGKD